MCWRLRLVLRRLGILIRNRDVREGKALLGAMPVLLTRRENDDCTGSDLDLLGLRRDNAPAFRDNQYLLACVRMELVHHALGEINLVDDELLAHLGCDEGLGRGGAGEERRHPFFGLNFADFDDFHNTLLSANFLLYSSSIRDRVKDGVC